MKQQMQGKSRKKALLIWYFLGWFGGLRFYMDKPRTAIAQLVLSLSFVGLLVTSIWWIVDLFLLQKWLEEDKVFAPQRSARS
ncbi:TM2 domain-containing protein [Paenibacillus athensensis]|uniref:TM2 domain-containing protein n=1 Tax=Paenibacillus athensensis TaxID=1967502 RepID=A0A4Y8QAJ4_9BACL|nr:TM2 domain-containing protein [Paenibacillus athensensis]MCD1257554.1 TM2 domain-containing protein [Paenibacillus athensensis]